MRSENVQKIGATLLAAIVVAFFIGCTPRSSEDAGGGDAAAANPEAAQWLLRAQDALEMGALNAALVLTDSAMQAAPELADVHFLRARTFTDLQRPELAEAAYQEVLERDPAYEGAWLNLGNVAFRKQAYALALERYRKELAAYPSPKVWVAIGSTYEGQRQPDSARYAYEQAISLDSTYASAYLHLGQLYKSTGALERAVEVSRTGVRLDAENINYRYALGSMLVLAGKSEEAVDHLGAVVEARPWHYWAHYNLGRAYAALGRSDEAQHHFDRAQHLQDDLQEIEYWKSLAGSNPDQFMLWVKLSSALRRTGREAEAQEADRVVRSLAPQYMAHEMANPTLSSEHRRAGMALINGDVADAVERYRNLARANADRPELWVNLGVLYAASGQVDAARKAWETALRHTPDHPGARAYLFQLDQPYIPGGRGDGARSEVERQELDR